MDWRNAQLGMNIARHLCEGILTLKGVLKDMKVSDSGFRRPWDCYAWEGYSSRRARQF